MSVRPCEKRTDSHIVHSLFFFLSSSSLLLLSFPEEHLRLKESSHHRLFIFGLLRVAAGMHGRSAVQSYSIEDKYSLCRLSEFWDQTDLLANYACVAKLAGLFSRATVSEQ